MAWNGCKPCVTVQAVAEIRKVRSKLGLCTSAVDVDVALRRAEEELINKTKASVILHFGAICFALLLWSPSWLV